MRKLGIALLALASGSAFFMIKGGPMWDTMACALGIMLAEGMFLGSICLAISLEQKKV